MARVLTGTERRHSVRTSYVVTIARIVVLPALAAALVACSSSDATGPAASPSSSTTTSSSSATATNYAQPANWLAAPSGPTKPVDVFYLYPTVWNRAQPSDSIIAAINDPKMQQGAAFALETQASAFDGVANVYAPYYRQAGSDVLNMTLQQRNKIVNGVPTTDALAAFDYYVKHLNAGRPFILAGHSQGSNLLVNLLSSYFSKHANVAKRMVAAYVIGYSVTSDYLASNPHLKFATRADDVGVIVSYNTQSPEMSGTNPVVEPGALVINPVSWTRSDTLAPAQSNLGSMLPQSNGTLSLVSDLADAQVNASKGVLECSTCNADTYSSSNPAFPHGVFHQYDYSFYYNNLSANAQTRIDRYLARH